MGRFYVIFHGPLYLKTGCISKRRAVIQIRNKPTFGPGKNRYVLNCLVPDNR